MASCWASASRRPQPPSSASEEKGGNKSRLFPPRPRKPQPGSGSFWGTLSFFSSSSFFLLLFLLAFGVSPCQGKPMAPHVLQGEQDLQLWNEIDGVCSSYLTRESPLQSSNALADICFMVLELLQKAQELDEKDITKRDELRIPGGIQSRGYFIFRPRNGRRSATFP